MIKYKFIQLEILFLQKKEYYYIKYIINLQFTFLYSYYVSIDIS